MLVYHGTSRQKLESILESGVNTPSYWGDLATAQGFADGHGCDGVILATNISKYPFEANVQLSESVCEQDDEHDLLEPHEIQRSLDELDSIVCYDIVTDFEVIEKTA